MTKFLTGVLLLVGVACSTTTKPAGQSPALREVFRGGELKGAETHDGADRGMPDDYDLVSHTCVSTPIFGLDGRYLRTSVRCW